MNDFSERFIAEARLHIGAPFRPHFKPTDLCAGGIVTLDTCMEQGMDTEGYDCSGLVVSSMCRALDLPPHNWPRTLRHAVQLQKHSIIKSFEPGDIQFYYYENGGVHSGIATTSLDTCVFASGKTGQVEEGFAADGAPPLAQRSLAAIHLRELVMKVL